MANQLHGPRLCPLPPSLSPLLIRHVTHAHPRCRYQLEKDGIPGSPKSAEQVAFEEAFRNATSTSARLDVGTGNADAAAMLPACHLHCSNQKAARWSELTVDGVTTEAAVVSWFFGDAAVPAYLEDSCEGYACGPGCTA